MMIPGSDSYRIDLAAPGRDVLGSWTFSGANRTWAERAVFERRPDGTPCFVFDSKAAIGGTRHRHIYSLDGDEFVLIRLEDEYGRLRKNTYGVNAHLVGPKPRLRTYEDCERALRSGPVAVLAELTLLGGHHNESNRKDNASPALDHPGVRARVLELRKSDDPWIREAAEAVPLPAGR
jgi:hypothetical protein